MSEIKRVVGIVGGTFDPIHFGHLRMALEAADRLALDEVRFIPAARPPHRGEPDATDQQRLEMVQLAIAGEKRFILDDREYRREGESYMVDTLESLRSELGENLSLILIMGSDAFLGLPAWYQWQRLLQLAHIVVVMRPGSSSAIAPCITLPPASLQSSASLRPLHTLHPVHNSELDPGAGASSQDLELQKLYDSHYSADLGDLQRRPCGAIYTLETTTLGISASNIRKMVAAGESPRFLLPETVLTYIDERNLYR